MKRKSMAPRNPYAMVAKTKQAGAHRKPYKSLRRQEKIKTRMCSSTGQSTRLLIEKLRIRVPPHPPKY